MNASTQASGRRGKATVAGLVLLGLLAVTPLEAGNTREKAPGFVDGSKFSQMVGDDSVSVEVSLHGALLKAVARIDPELSRLVGGLESIQAIVLSVPGDAGKGVADKLREMESDLLDKKGWEKLLAVREEQADIRILVLNDEEKILGLVVLVLDRGEGEMVFVNIAGDIDLAAIGELGEALDLPGLDALE